MGFNITLMNAVNSFNAPIIVAAASYLLVGLGDFLMNPFFGDGSKILSFMAILPTSVGIWQLYSKQVMIEMIGNIPQKEKPGLWVISTFLWLLIGFVSTSESICLCVFSSIIK